MKYRSFAISVAAFGLSAATASAEPVVHLSLERVAGFSNVSVDPDNDEGADFTFFSLGGPSASPLSSPRIGVDYLLQFGLTLGASFSYATGSITDDDTSYELSYSHYAFTPRIGYRAKLAPIFDLIPRLGLTFMGGTLTLPGSQSCTFNGFTTVCSDIPGDELSYSATAFSAEAVGVLRATTSFNVLAGFAIEPLLSADAENAQANGGSGRTVDTEKYEGSMLGLSFWLGLSGYL